MKEELQQFYSECLVAEGFRPTIDADGDVVFKFESLFFYIRPETNDLMYHCIILPGIWTIESERQRETVQRLATRLTHEYKVAKVKLFGDHVSVVAEMLLPEREAFGRVFVRLLHILRDTRREFLDAMRETEPPASRDSREEALGPRGNQTLTCGGGITIDRPVRDPDPAADAFERAFLAWLENELDLHPISHSGTNALYWRVEYQGNPAEIGVVGRRRSAGKITRPGVDWILRIEEPADGELIPLVASFFRPGSGILRRVHGGKVRMQFLSSDLRLAFLAA